MVHLDSAPSVSLYQRHILCINTVKLASKTLSIVALYTVSINIIIHNTVIILSIIGRFYPVSSSDLIRHTYIASSIMRAILKVIHAGVGFGSGTETRFTSIAGIAQ